MKKVILFGLLVLLSVYLFSQTNINQQLVSCDPTWQYAVMRHPIGNRSLQSADLDNNGADEIICGSNNYWYILYFNSQRNEHEFLWISEHYQEYIKRINVFDINNDNIMEIFVGFDDGTLKVYSGDARQLIKSTPASSSYLDEIHDIQYGDLDNDGNNELVVSNYQNLIIYDPVTFNIENILPYPANDFKIANVDNDIANEIITSQGYVLEYDGTTLQVEWIFNPDLTDYGYKVKVSDIDQDGKNEILYLKANLYVYDADIQALKYAFESQWSISGFLVQDINNDGSKELIYSESYYNEIVHCVNTQSLVELWTINSNRSGISEMSTGDFDMNGQTEIVFAPGVAQGIFMNIYDLNTQTLQWESYSMDGPFRAIDVEDVDNDGVKEIVAASYKSSNNTAGGILSVFDAVTHETEWQSDDLMFSMNWTGINDVKVADIDNDGKKEIIVAGGNSYDGEIWILDGTTKAIKSIHIYPSSEINWSFANFTVDDIDSDGQLEIIATTGYSYYVINPLDYNIEYSSPVFGYEGLTTIKTGNLNDDQVKDVVLNRFKLTVFNGLTHEIVESSAYSVSSFDLFDWNGDGIEEIIAGTYLGNILIFNGLTLQPIDTVNMNCGMIDAVVVSDLNNDGAPEIIYSTDGKICFYASDTQYAYTRLLDDSPGESTTIIVNDINGDNKKEIIAGTKHKIIEFAEECYRCIWFAMTKTSDNASCGVADGYIQIIPYGGQAPYSCTWNNGMTGNMITGLATGIYMANLIDQQGCVIIDTTYILQSVLSGKIETTNVSCQQVGDGSATLSISEGHAPYTYNWNNGSTSSSISNLFKGTYSVHVQDSKNCTLDLDAIVNKDTLLLDIFKNDVNCFGMSTGSVSVSPYNGSYPYIYLWNNGKTTSSQYNLPAGAYTVSVYDAQGCKSGASISINQPPAIILSAFSSPDDPQTVNLEGTAIVNAIGGVPPYSVQWDDPLEQTTVKAINLANSTYHAYVWDSHYCSQIITVKVGDPNDISENEALAGIVLFPNPTMGMINIDFGNLMPQVITIRVSDATGRLVTEFCQILSSDSKLPLDLTVLNPGFYILSIQSANGMRGFKIEVVR